jgi:hypothetical protein
LSRRPVACSTEERTVAMSYFEFLMVLVGLVGAIAISEILVF